MTIGELVLSLKVTPQEDDKATKKQPGYHKEDGMEHRCSVRKPFAFQLLLYKNGLPVQSGVSRNLGLGGAFVEAGSCEWRKNQRLEIEVLGCGKAGLRLPAVVVHQSEQGVGLMFDGLSSEQRRELRVLLFSNEKAEASSLGDGDAASGSRAVA